MKIVNVRYGFATNSSSSHSIIMARGLADDLSAADGLLGFGTENFVLASRLSKARYMAVAAFRDYVRVGKTPAEAAEAANRIFGTDVSVAGFNDSYIDHQSCPSFPTARRSDQSTDMLLEFFRRSIVDDDGIVILGGSDGSDNPMQKKGPLYQPYTDLVGKDYYQAGKKMFTLDPLGHVTLFDQNNGTKVRVVIDSKDKSPVRGTHPELIDVKLTDKCSFATRPVSPGGTSTRKGEGTHLNKICSACYQSSMAKGKHASMHTIQELVDQLRNTGCYEVALGGGACEEHPNFSEILRLFRGADIIPSFSTQSWEWLKNEKIVSAVRECCGAVALSTTNPHDVSPWLAAARDYGFRAHFHYVLGLEPLANLRAFLQTYPEDLKKNKKTREVLESLSKPIDKDSDSACMRPWGEGGKKTNDFWNDRDEIAHVVLLGYKEMGRATGKPPIPYDGWLDVIVDEKKALDRKNMALINAYKVKCKGMTNAQKSKVAYPFGTSFYWSFAVDSFLVNDVAKQADKHDIPLVRFENSDGKFSCYFDAVKQEWAAHSFVPYEDRIKGGPADFEKVWGQISNAASLQPTV